MWRSAIFWRLLGSFGLLLPGTVALLGAVLVSRVQDAVLRGSPAAAGEVVHLQRLVAVVTIAVALAGIALAWWLARRIEGPLRELTAAVERVAAGAYSQKVHAGAGAEIARLTRAFNRMSDHLALQFQDLDNDRQQLRTILSGMVEGVVAIDAEQRIVFANERASQLLDVYDQPVVGRRLWEAVRQRSLHDIATRALTAPGPHSEDLLWNGRTAKSLTVHADRLSGNGAGGAVLVIHDTSELRRLERLRQDFVANVSHELKTPLSVIKVCVETLLDGGAIDDLQHREGFLQQVAEQADRLHSLILDLLSLSRIESGTEAFSFQAVPLAGVVAECLERHRTRAEGRNQQLLAVSAEREVAAWADEEAVRQMLENLVDNALKYTPPGGRIQVRWQEYDGQVVVEVEDTGIGIPEADLPRIFERFYRVDKARSRELGGTGLGLSIVKHLAQAMKGSVDAHSKLGQGTTFCLRLPSAPV